MNLLHALRLNKTSPSVISLVGAGGKTTLLFRLAREYLTIKSKKVFVSTSTHLGQSQTELADHWLIYKDVSTLNAALDRLNGALLITGAEEGAKVCGLDENALRWLYEKSKAENIPFLIEADGSRQKPIKAPAVHEPPIPEFSETVVYVAGLSAIGKALTDEQVHRPQIFSQLANLEIGQPISPAAIVATLAHPQGGLKNIPTHAKRIALLNQADTPELQSIGGSMAKKLLHPFDAVLVGSLQQNHVQTFEKTAGIILAAGDATRFGKPKQLLDWKGKPFVRQVAETALKAGLEPVVVVTGACHAEIESCLSELPITLIQNPHPAEGQSASIKIGLQSISGPVGSVVFLLADQPQIPVNVIQALTEMHARALPAILAPLVLEEKRANPILFDRVTFSDLMQLTGDVGGRGIFHKHQVDYLPWHDERLLLDVDTPEDYARLQALE
ncbi:MAG: putative selenium-dependent hydroxylase accessory protein YqeC [Anaerolineales bacterium]|nr:putative selenium-dependent hydroxylase accessory protein YqeC [Anaerolineales bacterium]